MTLNGPYEIRNLADFLKVPKPRRAVCLSEFLLALEIFEQSMPIARNAFVYTWIDDSQNDITVTARVINHESPDELTVTWKGKSKATKES